METEVMNGFYCPSLSVHYLNCLNRYDEMVVDRMYS